MQMSDIQKTRPAIVDAASVVFVATGVLILAVAAGEARSPGIAASALSPQLLLGIAITSGLVSFAGAEHRAPSRLARFGYGIAGLGVTWGVASVAWRSFSALGSLGIALTILSALTAASLFILFRHQRTA